MSSPDRLRAIPHAESIPPFATRIYRMATRYLDGKDFVLREDPKATSTDYIIRKPKGRGKIRTVRISRSRLVNGGRVNEEIGVDPKIAVISITPDRPSAGELQPGISTWDDTIRDWKLMDTGELENLFEGLKQSVPVPEI